MMTWRLVFILQNYCNISEIHISEEIISSTSLPLQAPPTRRATPPPDISPAFFQCFQIFINTMKTHHKCHRSVTEHCFLLHNHQTCERVLRGSIPSYFLLVRNMEGHSICTQPGHCSTIRGTPNPMDEITKRKIPSERGEDMRRGQVMEDSTWVRMEDTQRQKETLRDGNNHKTSHFPITADHTFLLP